MSKKILVVDDEKDILDLIQLFLEDTGDFVVETAKSGNEAIEKIKANDYHAVVTDLTMPQGTGEDVFNFIIDSKYDFPLLFCSGFVGENQRKKFMQRKNTMISEKPNFMGKIIEFSHFVLQFYDAPEVHSTSYYRVPLEIFSDKVKLPSDFFIRLGEDHFVKRFQKGDEVGKEDLKKLREKSISFLYAEQSSVVTLVESYVKRVKSFLKDIQSCALEPVIREEWIPMLQSLCSFEDMGEESKEFLHQSVETVKKEVNEEPKFQKLLDRLKSQKNSIVANSMLLMYTAPAFAMKNGITDEEIIKAMIFAALMHDSALENPSLAEEDHPSDVMLVGWTQDDLTKFENHPMDAAKLLSQKPGVSPHAIRFVESHHERPDGGGFPKHMKESGMDVELSVFLLAHQCVRLLSKQVRNDPEKEKEVTIKDVIKTLPEVWRIGKFKKIIEVVS